MIGKPFVILQSIDSTNNYAMKEARKGIIKNGSAFFALEQTQGRGQRSKEWVSNRGENILMTVVIDCKAFQLHQQALLSFAVALAASNMLKNYTKGSTRIKWPNDIYWCDRKAGGILIENIVMGNNWTYAIIGIGINVNQTVFEKVEKATVSLKQITGKDHNPIFLAKKLCKELDKSLMEMKTNPEKLLMNYNDVLYKKGQQVKLKQGNILFEATIQGVNDRGQLLIIQGIEKTLNFGEVEWII